MRKKFLVALFALVLIAGNLSAWEYPGLQGTLIGTGIGCMLVPFIVEEDSGISTYLYIAGGIFIASGTIWMLFDILDNGLASYKPDYGFEYVSYNGGSVPVYNKKQRKYNFLREHILFGQTPKQEFYVGAAFKF